MKTGTLHFVIGKMGAGKSTFARQFSKENAFILISEDEWLSKLYPNEIHSFDDFLVRHRLLLNVLKPHIQSLLSSGVSVVMDFPANTRKTRQWFINLATEVDAPHQATYLNSSDEQCLNQIALRRIQNPERAKFDTPEMFASVTSVFEEPDESEGLWLNIIDGK